MATIKSKLTDEEKKKVKRLTGLENVNSTSATSTSDVKNNSPIKYNKVSGSEPRATTAEQIKTEADDYFNNLLANKSNEKSNASGSAEGIQTTTRAVQSAKSGNISNMPYVEDNYSGGAIYSDPKNLDELFTNLDSINKSHEGKTDKDYYEDLLPEVKASLGLQKLDEVTIDEKEIRKQVEDILTGEYDLKKQSVVASTNREIENERQSQLDLINSAEANKEEITEIYDEAKIASSNTSLKRGLARSSIALLSINGLEKQKAEELSTLAKNLTSELDQSEDNIRNLRSELELALESLDIEYAVEVNNEIKKEVNSLYEKQKEVISFNNNIDKLEADYQSKRTSLMEERNKMEAKLAEEYEGIAEREKNNDMKSAVIEYFAGLTKAEAIKQLTSDNRFIDYLGSSFYDVYYKIMRRQD